MERGGKEDVEEDLGERPHIHRQGRHVPDSLLWSGGADKLHYVLVHTPESCFIGPFLLNATLYIRHLPNRRNSTVAAS